MNKRKSIIVIIGLVLLLSSCALASAQSQTIQDPVGDVMHWRQTDTTWGWNTNIATKPNIDITEISYSVSGEQVTLSLEVAGTIASSDLIIYWAHLNTSDSSYLLQWSDGEGIGWAINIADGSYQMDYSPEITASGNTITGVFDVVGTFTTDVNLWGWAVEYTSYDDQQLSEWWADWAPNERSPYYEDYIDSDDPVDDPDETTPPETGNGETPDPTNGQGTPGFELLAVLAALGAAHILIKKRK